MTFPSPQGLKRYFKPSAVAMVVLFLIFKNHGLSDWNVRLLDHVMQSYPLQQRQETKQMKKKPLFYLLGPSRKTQGNFIFL